MYLLIETSTERGMIALMKGGDILLSQELPFGQDQSKHLMPRLVSLLEPFSLPESLRAIGVGIGPGSYTGIRIGVAVAQSLAYSWKVPLVGVSSLYGFHPEGGEGSFASIIDARIGGVYILKGIKRGETFIYQDRPSVLAIEELESYLGHIVHLVTPSARALRGRLGEAYPKCEWTWEERSPSAMTLFKQIDGAYSEGIFVQPPGHLDILYLRETEAERVKKKMQNYPKVGFEEERFVNGTS